MKVGYIPTVNCEQLGVYIGKNAAKIAAIRKFIDVFLINEYANFSKEEILQGIQDIIEHDQYKDWCWIEEVPIYEKG